MSGIFCVLKAKVVCIVFQNQKAPTQKGKHWKHIREMIKDYVDSVVCMCINRESRDIQWLQYVAILRKIRLAPKLIGVPKGNDRLPTINVQGLFLLVSGRVVSGRRRIIILPCHCSLDTSLAVKVYSSHGHTANKVEWCLVLQETWTPRCGILNMAFLKWHGECKMKSVNPEGAWDGFRCWLFERKCPKNHGISSHWWGLEIQ